MRELLRLRHIVQICAAMLLAALLAYIPHIIEFAEPSEGSTLITVFLTFVLVFMMNEPIKNNRDLNRNVNLELSRIRRVHHLAEKMSTRRSKWFKEIEKAVFDYLDFFKKNSFRAYSREREPFREITHAIYGFKPKSRREEILFEEMLVASRELAATRQNIGALVKSRISAYRWVVLLTIEGLMIFSTLISQGPSTLSYLINVALLSTVFVVTLLIYETDHYSPEEFEALAKRYVDNKSSLINEHKH